MGAATLYQVADGPGRPGGPKLRPGIPANSLTTRRACTLSNAAGPNFRLLVPKLRLGTHLREALLRIPARRLRFASSDSAGSGASRTCVPKRSLGKRLPRRFAGKPP